MVVDEIYDQLDRFVHDKNFFTARYAEMVSQAINQSVDVVAKSAVGLFVLITVLHPNAHVLVNLLIVGTIILLTYIYRNERPNRDHLLVLWSIILLPIKFPYRFCFSLLTLFDRHLEFIPFYYVLKVMALLLLFLRPIRAVSFIKLHLFKLRIYALGVETDIASTADSSTRVHRME